MPQLVTHAEPRRYLVPVHDVQVVALPEHVAQVLSQIEQLDPDRNFPLEHPVQLVEVPEQVAQV